MSDPFTKSHIRKALGFTTDAELAAFFGVSSSAVSQWPEDEPIPELRQLQAERKRPEIFMANEVTEPDSGAALSEAA